MLWQRLLFGTLMIAALSGIIYLDGHLSAAASRQGDVRPAELLWCGLPVTLLVVLLVVLASFEMGRMCVAGGLRPVTWWAAFVGAGLAFLPWVEMQQRLVSLTLANPLPQSHSSLTLLWLGGGLLGTALATLGRRTTQQALSSMAVTMFIILYLGLLASFAVRVRCIWPGPAGGAIMVYFLLTVKAGDIGAYFVGMSMGKHKLAPWLSPGKTIEGAVGAVLLAGLVGVGGMALWSGSGRLGPAPLTLMQALVFGVLMAVAGHLGDLVESAMKRDTGVKDSGAVVPAFGGLLDIVDSPLFTAPVAWWLLTVWTQTD